MLEVKFQGVCEDRNGYSDADWAGCMRTARSTSAGVTMRGSHVIMSRAATQKKVTLISGEAEQVEAVRMSTGSDSCATRFRCPPLA